MGVRVTADGEGRDVQMAGRVALLVAAVVVAGIGAVLVVLYANQADERARAALEPRSVLVVIEPVSAGVTVRQAVEAGALELDDIPGDAVVDEALGDVTGVADLVITTDLYPGEQLIQPKLGSGTDLDPLGIPEGRIASSFLFEDPERVASFLSPGSEVAVFLTRTTPQGPTTRLLLERVEVLGVGGTPQDPAAGQPAAEVSRALLTLSLDQRQAERLILAQTLGELYLGLLTDTSQVVPDLGVTDEDLFEVTP